MLLEVNFLGKLNDDMVGFYRSGYQKADGTKGYIATTQMEPTGARQAFPCFDEPALKASFDITLIAEKHLTCLSNMPIMSETDVQSVITGAPRKAVRFATSPIMSTYLVAFVIGELHYVESKAFRVPVRTYVTIDQDVEHGRYAAELGARTLELFEKEFGVEFPLPKMGQIAVLDFAEGAMENWGLIAYRAVDLLIEPNAGAARKRRVTDTVIHELAHSFYPEWDIWGPTLSLVRYKMRCGSTHLEAVILWKYQSRVQARSTRSSMQSRMKKVALFYE